MPISSKSEFKILRVRVYAFIEKFYREPNEERGTQDTPLVNAKAKNSIIVNSPLRSVECRL